LCLWTIRKDCLSKNKIPDEKTTKNLMNI
jgi:hypothetical protein